MASSQQLVEHTLSNGKTVFCVHNTLEVEIVSQQVEGYLEHVTLKKGDVVFDVGANVGLFALLLHERFEGQVDVYAFEPVPDTFRALLANVERYAGTEGPLYAEPVGLSDACKTIEFTYFSNATSMSTAYPEGAKEELVEASMAWYTKFQKEKPIFKLLPVGLVSRVLRFKLNWDMKPTPIQCSMVTLSHFLRERGLKQVDLLKLDVEKSEWDVFVGIDDEHWPCIRQVIAEIHDSDDRLNKVKTLLTSKGFDTVLVYQESDLQGSDTYNVYASR